MARKISRKGLVKKADTVMSKYIRARDKKCVLCGSTYMLQNGHIFSRVAYSTRWEEDNCWAQCASCNIAHERDAYPYLKWAEKKLGKKRLEELHLQHHQPKKFTDQDLQDICDIYQQKLMECDQWC